MQKSFLSIIFIFGLSIGHFAAGLMNTPSPSKEVNDSNSILSVERAFRYKCAAREIKLLVDGVAIGKVRNNRSSSFVLPAGKHLIQAKMDSWKSQELMIDLVSCQEKKIFLSINRNPFSAYSGKQNYLKLSEYLK